MKKVFAAFIAGLIIALSGQALSDGYVEAEFAENPQYIYKELRDLAMATELMREKLDNIAEALQAGGERDDSHQAKINAIADKLDAENVLLMDTDYRAVLEAL